MVLHSSILYLLFMKRKAYILLFLIGSIISGCSKFSRIQKSDNIDLKYKAAVEFYEKKQYYKASTLFEELIPLMKGQAEAEKATFYYAYSQFYMGQYVVSEYHFRRFHETFPRSPLAEEAYYMECVSLFEDSPDFELDQTNTLKALNSIQQFIQEYPKSKFMPDCNNMIDKLTLKLENKYYNLSKLYHHMREYKSAVVAFDNLIKDFPSSRYVEEAFFLKVEAQYKYAEESIESKQRARMEKCMEFYLSFIDKFPNSKYTSNAEVYYDKAQAKVKYIEEAGIVQEKDQLTN